MIETKKIKTALVSVFYKDGLDEIIKKLDAEGVKFISTGGTQKFIESLGIECTPVEQLTTYPAIFAITSDSIVTLPFAKLNLASAIIIILSEYRLY